MAESHHHDYTSTVDVLHSSELAKVRHKIWLTDDLIDQIVYKLYGPTEEEIAIVEGRA